MQIRYPDAKMRGWILDTMPQHARVDMFLDKKLKPNTCKVIDGDDFVIVEFGKVSVPPRPRRSAA